MNCHNCGSLNVKKESNKIIYGKEYGNGRCFYCHDCKASVGMHNNGKPLGTLASSNVLILRKACHDIFDKVWKYQKQEKRGKLYTILADKMSIPKEECHFGTFQRNRCLQALEIMTIDKWWELNKKTEEQKND